MMMMMMMTNIISLTKSVQRTAGDNAAHMHATRASNRLQSRQQQQLICSSVSVSTRQKVSRSHPSSKFPAKSNSRHNVARQFDINGVNSGGGAWAVRTLQTTTLSQHPEVVTLHSRCDGWLSHVQPQSTRGRQFDIRREI